MKEFDLDEYFKSCGCIKITTMKELESYKDNITAGTYSTAKFAIEQMKPVYLKNDL